MNYKKLIQEIEEMENDDENLPRLEKAAESYCGNYELCSGFKHALINELTDQYENHPEDQLPEDLPKLSDILNGAI